MSRLRVLVVSIAVTVVACGHRHAGIAPPPQPARSADSAHAIGVATETIAIATPHSGLEGFTPAFPAVDSGGVCGYLPPAARTLGEWVAFLTFSSEAKPVRRVTVRYDSTGTLTYYSDERGDLTPARVARAPDGTTHLVLPPGRRTEIVIAVARGFGLARNVGGGEPEESFTAPVSVMLDAANLAQPAEMAERIRAQCR